MAEPRVTLPDIFRYSWRDIRLHWKIAFAMIWLPALGMSVVGVWLNYFFGQHFSLFVTNFVAGSIAGENESYGLTFQVLLFVVISTGVNLIAQGVVGSTWLRWLDNRKKGETNIAGDIQQSYYRLRDPVYKKFLTAWVMLSLIGSGVIVAVVLLWGVGFGIIGRTGNGVSGLLVGMLFGVPASSYVLGRYSMVLPWSVKAVPNKKFKESWQQTSSLGAELTGLFFVAWYLLPLFLLLPSQILQGIFTVLGVGDMMLKTLLISFVSNSFVLIAVLFLVGGLLYLYDGWLANSPEKKQPEG